MSSYGGSCYSGRWDVVYFVLSCNVGFVVLSFLFGNENLVILLSKKENDVGPTKSE